MERKDYVGNVLWVISERWPRKKKIIHIYYTVQCNMCNCWGGLYHYCKLSINNILKALLLEFVFFFQWSTVLWRQFCWTDGKQRSDQSASEERGCARKIKIWLKVLLQRQNENNIIWIPAKSWHFDKLGEWDSYRYSIL